MPILGIMASQISGHLETNSYESIQTVTVGSGGAANAVFSSIPSTYKHLQIRAFHQSTGSPESHMRFNGDTGNNYKIHFLYGDGGSAVGGTGGTTNAVSFNYNGGSGSVFGASVTDILDYTNTNKNTTTRSLGGYDANGSGLEIYYSGLWINTAAITSITLYPVSGNFAQYSSFALYGIKG
jgi:hypothetical protein